jgi:hypothetical protein
MTWSGRRIRMTCRGKGTLYLARGGVGEGCSKAKAETTQPHIQTPQPNPTSPHPNVISTSQQSSVRQRML